MLLLVSQWLYLQSGSWCMLNNRTSQSRFNTTAVKLILEFKLSLPYAIHLHRVEYIYSMSYVEITEQKYIPNWSSLQLIRTSLNIQSGISYYQIHHIQ
jgi:hypothetical protein